MNRSLLLAATATLLLIGVSSGDAAGPFEQKLPQDRQVQHVLNRLTFGPRPGDAEDVRRLGLTKWIELQLHPDRIPENPALDAKLKPLEALRMNQAEIMQSYGQLLPPIVFQPQLAMNTLLTQDQLRKVQIGTAEERTAVLKALEPEKRKQILAGLPPQVLEYTPEFQKEGEDARKMMQEETQKENRRRNPQLVDLLSGDQLAAARSGNKEKIEALFAVLDPEKRIQVAGVLPQQSLSAMPELRRLGQTRRQPRLVPSQDLKEAKMLRAIYSNRQLEEVLVDFWFNHFNVDQAKNVPQSQNEVHLLIGSYERDAIRPHVLGHFKDLLLATARHPAMLYYLDNWQSMANNAVDVGPFAPQRGVVNGVPNSLLPSPLARLAHGLNENYGREVLELHTLGVKGGYTQEDVIAVARCFTGWTVRDPMNPEFVFAPFMHDFGEKVVLGHKIAAGGGEQDGLRAIDILAHHPSTAKFLSRELAQRFVADDPPQSLVDRMAQTFTKSDGDLRAVLETMFTSTEFISEGAWQSKIKSPFEMVASAVRATGSETRDGFALAQRVVDLGQVLYNKLEPSGFPNTGEVWLSTIGVLGRITFATALTAGQVPGVTWDAARFAGKEPMAVARDLLGRDPSAPTWSAIEAGVNEKTRPPAFIAALVLGSPDFQRR
jgi:uncharacterized protein (DUF1800 family)